MRTLSDKTRAVLDGWAQFYAGVYAQDRQNGQVVNLVERLVDGRPGKSVDVKYHSRDWIIFQFYKFTFKDEFEYTVGAFKQHLGPAALADFEARIGELPPRSDEIFAQAVANLNAKRMEK